MLSTINNSPQNSRWSTQTILLLFCTVLFMVFKTCSLTYRLNVKQIKQKSLLKAIKPIYFTHNYAWLHGQKHLRFAFSISFKNRTCHTFYKENILYEYDYRLNNRRQRKHVNVLKCVALYLPEEEERQDDLQRRWPQHVQEGGEIHEALGVHRHQVHHLTHRRRALGLVCDH